LDEHRNTNVGECLQIDKTGQFFCYVSPTSGCADKKPSQRNIGAFYSYRGCDIMAATDIFLPRKQKKRVQAAERKVKLDARRGRSHS
jgi:hypothetical protein